MVELVAAGRPEIGPAFSVRFPAELTRRVDEAAAEGSSSRAAWLRRAAEEQLAYPREVLAQLATWMHDEGLSSDIGYALDKPWKHQDFIYCAQHGIGGAHLDLLQERRRQALEQDDLPAGWRVEETTPVDYRVVCGHGEAICDSEAERDGACPAGCSRGCSLPVLVDVGEAETADVVALNSARKGRRRGDQS